KAAAAYEAFVKKLDQKFIRVGFSLNGSLINFICAPIEPHDIERLGELNAIRIKEIDSKA
ncbi:MAG: hypothetical protein HQL28_06570, partial [Candidatus Omnitrophica bacterium]|nr:hypothetical protein [Candidatus Omnitrophota bacterium]